MTNICAVVIAYNEEQNIRNTMKILNKLKKNKILTNIIVVNDGSTDNTAKLAKKFGATVVSHKKNLGKKSGFISGALAAKDLGSEILISLDADILKLPKESILKLIEPLKKGKLMSIGKQYEKSIKINIGFKWLKEIIFKKKYQLKNSIFFQT